MITLLLLVAVSAWASELVVEGDGWTYSCYGNCQQDVQTKTEGGVIMVGGATLPDEALRWLNKNSGGGDILAIRASGDMGYNKYFYDLGGINSAATVMINEAGPPSYDPFIVDKIRKCEGLFFGGGDQWKYYSWWKDTPLGLEVQKLIQRNVTIGGTSAGMAIQAAYPFVAEFGGADPYEALADPYNKDVTLGNNFLVHHLLPSTATDTHFAQRDRMGRIVTFVARVMADQGTHALGIACDEGTAVLVDENFRGRVVSQEPNTTSVQDGFLPNQAYFFVGKTAPQVCQPGVPLTFNDLQVYRLQQGDRFNFKDLNTTDGVSYIINTYKGKMSAVGNNGNIY